MTSPTVTFVVPCYNIAHLLLECINSILTQTFKDFEILIMDDASPDNPGEVVRGIRDDRVRYVRNESNLGSLRNYNKGIALSRGKYIWLISADDYIRDKDALRKYVEVFENHPRVGFVYSAGIAVVAGEERGILSYATYGSRDKIIGGRELLRKLLFRNIVLAPAGMIRRECYERLGVFPVTPGMVYSADWYMWCQIALYYDVGYFAEPLVAYRQHELSMTTHLTQSRADLMVEGMLQVQWLIKEQADKLGMKDISDICLKSLGRIYGKHLASAHFGLPKPVLTWEDVDRQLKDHALAAEEERNLRARIHAAIADVVYHRQEFGKALEGYRAALHHNSGLLNARLKMLLLRSGAFGRLTRRLATGRGV